MSRIRKFADEHEVVVRFEALKAHIRQKQDERREKIHFLFPFRSDSPLADHLREAEETWERRFHKE